MFNDINISLCSNYNGLDPLKLLDYPLEDVFDLINATMDYNVRNKKDDSKSGNNDRVIRKKAGDNWF